ncbi:MAG TPA: asparagine synthase (glutamine-hydrolyzing) [Hyphomicrobiaceae bacterium]|nr:asparagine synthase (glutamine-hydrolyzing) [Hyphomicrobiaceae bacterium]
MCGFMLVIERGRPVDERRLQAAAALIRHRGPDASGLAVFEPTLNRAPGSERVSVGVVHHRLAIIDLDSRSHQPFRRGSRMLAYNGEIYNFEELRGGLEQRGLRFHTAGDTEVLFELFGADGLDGLRRANGMWAFCHLDEVAGRLIAARDRYGKKPLYYHEGERTICFASEITPILAYLGQRARLKPHALATYLAHGWLFPGDAEATHLDGIRQVLPGGCVSLDLDTWALRSARHLDIAEEAARKPPADGPADLIEQAVLARLVSDRKVGLLLSGGIDSSLILSCLAANKLQDAVCCFTGDAGKSEDAQYARQCVAALGIQARFIPLDYELSGMDRFLKVCRHQEKPFPLIGNVLAMPQMYEAIAASDVRVVLDGTGGDEIFGGYWDRYHAFAVSDARAKGDRAWLARSEFHAGLQGGSSRTRQGAIGKTDLEKYCRAAVLGASSSDPLTTRRLGFDEALLADARGGRLQEWMWQNDRNAMLASVENRSPFLDYRLAPFLRTGYRYKFDDGWNKLELRRAFDRFRPLPTQWRREKQGFRWIYGRFFRANRARILDLVSASRILPPVLALSELIDRAHKSEDVLSSELMQRALCIAGLEEAMGMGAGGGASEPVAQTPAITFK